MALYRQESTFCGDFSVTPIGIRYISDIASGGVLQTASQPSITISTGR